MLLTEHMIDVLAGIDADVALDPARRRNLAGSIRRNPVDRHVVGEVTNSACTDEQHCDWQGEWALAHWAKINTGDEAAVSITAKIRKEMLTGAIAGAPTIDSDTGQLAVTSRSAAGGKLSNLSWRSTGLVHLARPYSTIQPAITATMTIAPAAIATHSQIGKPKNRIRQMGILFGIGQMATVIATNTPAAATAMATA